MMLLEDELPKKLVLFFEKKETKERNKKCLKTILPIANMC